MRAILIVSALLLGSLPNARAQSSFDSNTTYRIPLDGAPVRGPDDALITIVELSDFGCPYCGRAQKTLEDIERLYPGQVRVVFLHNPLDPEEGTLAAEASMAAFDQGQFWPMHDRIFAAGGVVTRAQIEAFALELGLDVSRLRRDLDTRKFLTAVHQDAEFAHRLGIRATPVFFVNGRLIKGALPLAVFVEIIEQELIRARALLARGVAPVDIYDAITAGNGTGPQDSPAVPVDQPSDPSAGPPIWRVGLGLPGHVDGPDDALVTIVVFADFECPYCRQALPAIARARAEYPHDVRIVFRHLPLFFHKTALLSAEAAVAAAAQGKFRAMHDHIFAGKDHPTRADLEHYASEISLDMNMFRAALDERRYLEAVAADSAAGGALGVRGTPTFFINGAPLRGAPSYEYLKRVFIEPKLTEANALLQRGVARNNVYKAIMGMSDYSVIDGDAGFAKGGNGEDRSSELEMGDFQRTIMQTCRARDYERAKTLYAKLAAGPGRDKVRAYCQPYGVDFLE